MAVLVREVTLKKVEQCPVAEQPISFRKVDRFFESLRMKHSLIQCDIMKVLFVNKSALTIGFVQVTWIGMSLFFWTSVIPPVVAQSERYAVPDKHPRLLGSLDRLQKLARERAEAYKRVVKVARELGADDHSKMISMALVAAIEEDEQLGKAAVRMAMKYVNGPIRKGHVPFGHDLARCAIVYDMCYEY